MQIETGLFPGHVLQRKKGGARVAITGTCAEYGIVYATVKSAEGTLKKFAHVAIGRGKQRRFNAELKGLPTGGPYVLTLTCGKETLEIPDIFVGDLWLMAGQSNMEGCALMKSVPEPHPLVRNFTMARRWEIAREPLHLRPESPDPVHEGKSLSRQQSLELRRKTTKGMSVGLHLGRLLHEQTGVPQGFICTAHGGTSMAQWDPAKKARGGESLYGSMWLSLQAVGQPLAGVLWAQGESEALPESAEVYTPVMKRFVAAFRRDLKQPRLPWLFIQMGRIIKGSPALTGLWPDPDSWNSVQDQQRLLARNIPQSALVPTVDLELDDIAHIGWDAFPLQAQRMAEVLGHLVHRRKGAKPGLDFKAARFLAGPVRQSNFIEVRFSNVVGKISSAGPVRGFVLLDAQGVPRPGIFRVELKRDKALLHLNHDFIPTGLRLRYGHGLDPICTLVDARGMAVPAFGPVEIESVPVI